MMQDRKSSNNNAYSPIEVRLTRRMPCTDNEDVDLRLPRSHSAHERGSRVFYDYMDSERHPGTPLLRLERITGA